MDAWQWVLTVCGGIATVCGGIATVCGAAAAVKKLFWPVVRIAKRVEALELREKHGAARFERMGNELARREKDDQALYRAILSMLNHMIDGNSVENMKQARMALNEHIINK